MVKFNLWSETLIFASVYAVLIIVPCLVVALIGRKMIEQIGNYPSQTPVFQMSIFIKLIVTEIISFSLLIGFYLAFAN